MWMLTLAAFAAEPAISGTWVLAETASELEAKHSEALEAGVAQLPWAIRPLARGRLAKPISNCAELALDLTAATFRARCDDDPEFVRERAGAAPTIQGKDGGTYTVGLEATSAHVELSFSGDDGGQRTRYAIADGRLLLTKEIVSSYFEQPVRWTVAYRRK